MKSAWRLRLSSGSSLAVSRSEHLIEFRRGAHRSEVLRASPTIKKHLIDEPPFALHRELRHENKIAARIQAVKPRSTQRVHPYQAALRVVDGKLMADAPKPFVRARVFHREVSIKYTKFAPVVFNEACAAERENDRLIRQGLQATFDHARGTNVTCRCPLEEFSPRLARGEIPVGRRTEVLLLPDRAYAVIALRYFRTNGPGRVR